MEGLWLRSKWGERPSFPTELGRIGSFTSLCGQFGALIEVRCQTEALVDDSRFKQLVEKIARQVASQAPQYLFFEDIPGGIVEAEVASLREVYLQEGKPERIAQRLAEGKAIRPLREMCLMEQELLDDRLKTVGCLIKETVGIVGEYIRISRYSRYAFSGGVGKS